MHLLENLNNSEVAFHVLKEKKLHGFSPRANYTDRERLPLVGEVSANF
jgi:hypothetical protein